MSAALGCWIDGVPGDALPADDRAIHYGDGVFETVAVRAGKPRFIEAHLARLSLGCVRLAIPFTALDELRAEISAACAHAPPRALVKIIVTRGSAMRRGYAPQGTESPRRLLSLWPTAAADFREGVDLRVATLRLGENPMLAGIKHLNRLENVLAAAERSETDAFESLLLDSSGNLVCGSMSNVFLVTRGQVATPRIDRCGVAGVMRGIVLRECGALGIVATETRLSLADLFAADEVFITNARIGVVPARRVGEHSVGMNTLALRLAAHLEPLDA
ncbi:MAG TPA: aminodeoxychorismate lyase [Steroidobacteraceae bacterium]|nr:aminodeoxychorismate lyase [Steroidobacteraceae bacterium]